ncbi:MAG: protein-L-isoaspartate(D-aspartate) O-methyltransferase [Candidatus Omnitrophica bacterium]|nr:protein-L-isoaspartate(D-aspartate) O-methyltransferase [Candidatus Omnitrophota bacterium]
MKRLEAERQRMLRDQLVARGIQDPRVLRAMGAVPRHRFVPESHQHQSYSDHPVSIGEGQTISQPYMVALMTESAAPGPASKVLEIGTGSGYQTALLAELSSQVYSIERLPVLAERAEGLLRALGYSNVHIRVGDGTLGWPEESPFDAILVDAGAPDLPQALVDQLVEGGRLVIPVGLSGSQTLTVVERSKGQVEKRELCSCLFVPLIGAQGWKEGEPGAGRDDPS